MIYVDKKLINLPFYVSNLTDSTASKKLRTAATVRIKFRLFHGVSNLSRSDKISFGIAVSRSKRAIILFNGTFPNIVTTNTQITYNAVADNRRPNEKGKSDW